MDVLSCEFYGDHHHPPTAGPLYNGPEVHAMQDVPRNVSVGSPDRIFVHFVGRVYEPYIRIAVDGFTCSKEVDDFAEGPVDQLPLHEVLKGFLVRLSSVGHPESTPLL